MLTQKDKYKLADDIVIMGGCMVELPHGKRTPGAAYNKLAARYGKEWTEGVKQLTAKDFNTILAQEYKTDPDPITKALAWQKEQKRKQKHENKHRTSSRQDR